MLVDPEDPDPARRLKQYNSALLVNADGSTGERYDKIHRIPFGEYIPLREEWPWLARFTPYDGLSYHLSQGKELKRFELGRYKFGVLICYEDTDPALARQYGVPHPDGPPVDFLVNISNDGWYAGTSEHNEHLAIARFRAVETRKSVARAVNMGISAIIDPNGRVLKPWTKFDNGVRSWDIPAGAINVADLPLGEWNQYKQCSGVLTASMPIDHRITLYSLWGDWFANTCWVIVIVGVILALMPARRFRPMY
jgi:apolipoprotein N-acyltransferase